ncbi:MAG: MaoC/PaaZ C-terminal domain-containing protein, partial [Microbacterium sp.]
GRTRRQAPRRILVRRLFRVAHRLGGVGTGGGAGVDGGADADEPMRDAEQPAREEAPGRPSGPPRSVLRATLAATVRYQGASGDFNPLHFDLARARRAGLDRLPAIGMLTGARAAGEALRGRDPASLRSFEIRWRRPAWVGDEIALFLEDRDPERVEVTAVRGDEVHARARAVFARRAGA